jgi:hypothetical protein
VIDEVSKAVDHSASGFTIHYCQGFKDALSLRAGNSWDGDSYALPEKRATEQLVLLLLVVMSGYRLSFRGGIAKHAYVHIEDVRNHG